MILINSLAEPTKVINSRSSKKRPLVWRRRQGVKSGLTFTTYERPSLADNKRVIANKNNDVFNLGKLIISIASSFAHDAHAAQYDSLWLAQTVEDTLSASSEDTLTPLSIAHTTYATLKHYDELAAVQYAARHHLITKLRKRGRPSIK